MLKTIKEIATTVLLALLIYFFISIFFRVGQIDGSSMNPTFEDGNRVLISRQAKNFESGDIIAFKYGDVEDSYFEDTYHLNSTYQNSLHIKRIIGVPGDEVKIKNNTVYINDKEKSKTDVTLENQEYTLKDNQYFVQGDNLDDSYDSRMHGPITDDEIYGKIISFKKNN